MPTISDQEIQNIVTRVLGQLPKKREPNNSQSHASKHKTIALGADHGGYAMKEMLKLHLEKLGHKIIDCGTHSIDSVDYPDFALAVGKKVGQKEACCGIIIDGAGITFSRHFLIKLSEINKT